jgi:hypothetical protein
MAGRLRGLLRPALATLAQVASLEPKLLPRRTADGGEGGSGPRGCVRKIVCGGWGGVRWVSLGLGYDCQLRRRPGVSRGPGGWRRRGHRLGGAKFGPGGVAEGPDRREAEAESQAESQAEGEVGAVALSCCTVGRAVSFDVGDVNLGAAV